MVGRQLKYRRDRSVWDDLTGVSDVDDRRQVAGAVPPHGEVMVGHRAIGDDDAVVDGQGLGWRQPVAGDSGPEREPDLRRATVWGVCRPGWQ